IRRLADAIGPGGDGAAGIELYLEGLTHIVGVARLVGVELGEEPAAGPQGEHIAHDAASLIGIEHRGGIPAHIVEASRHTAIAHMARLLAEAAGHGMVALQAQRAIDEDVARLAHAGSVTRPSSASGQNGLWAISHRCPSGSAK